MDHNTLYVYTRRHWNEAVFRKTSKMARHFFMEWNDVQNFMDLARVLHKKCINQIPKVMAQSLVSSMKRRCVGACGV